MPLVGAAISFTSSITVQDISTAITNALATDTNVKAGSIKIDDEKLQEIMDKFPEAHEKASEVIRMIDTNTVKIIDDMIQK